ncbi:aspartate carbamoyltransferase [Klebsiella pneumoniae]|uniref:Aspartate carbamoyltransferase regulatory chain n=1 Tax=Klebsiella pneumoniae TaxID=573 RepID=A0A2X3D6Y7_KLEPN|nr:aspartate carbamoyltransferase [Klebsiella pneumoniae]
MTHDNKLQVEAIKRGTVIDHIPAQVGFKLLTLFKLTETDQRITIGLNLPSGEMGRKDLIKIENTFLTDEQVNQLSLYAPQATVNRIDDYEVVGKSRPSLRIVSTVCWSVRTATVSATPNRFLPVLQ